nr:uncharacterized protein LOC108945484 [Nicotiana tomentosiformis]
MQLHTLRHDNAIIEAYVQKAKGITDRLAALQHLIPNDDLVEFVLAGLGPAYRPFTRSLESRQEDIMFDALYGFLLNEERQLKRYDTINVIAPTAHFTQSSISTTRGHGRGREGVVADAPPSKGSHRITKIVTFRHLTNRLKQINNLLTSPDLSAIIVKEKVILHGYVLHHELTVSAWCLADPLLILPVLPIHLHKPG